MNIRNSFDWKWPMRMWNERLIPYLCTQHLVGYHAEIHKFRHIFIKHYSINGRIDPVVQIEPENMKKYHDIIAKRLKNHNSPYEQPDLSYLHPYQRYAQTNYEYDKKDLISRCKECACNINNGVVRG